MRGRIAALSIAGAALACVAAWWFIGGRAPAPPSLELFVTVESAGEASRGPAVRAGDGVRVTVKTEPGAHLTLLVLDSSDRVALPALTVNRQVPADGLLQTFFTVDDVPGREQFLALATRGAVPDPAAIVQAANAGADRPARREALRDALADRLLRGSYALEAGPELDHVR
jgi:hypothetical protein